MLSRHPESSSSLSDVSPTVYSNWQTEVLPPPETGRTSFIVILSVCVAILIHAGLLALLFTQTSNKSIILNRISAPSSIRVSMVSAPQQPESPEAFTATAPSPRVLTSKTSQRTVAQQPPEVVHSESTKPKPTPVKTKPVKTKHEPVKPKATILPSESPATQRKEAESVPAHAREIPASDPGKKMVELPSQGPKNVQSIGCRVPSPEYPRQARRQRIEGTVLIDLQIDSSGQITSANVSRSSGNADLDEAARKTVMRASCSPYVENGHGIAVRAVQPISFRLSR